MRLVELDRRVLRVPSPAPDARIADAAVVLAEIAIEQRVADRAHHRAIAAVVMQMGIEYPHVARRIDARLVIRAGDLHAGFVVIEGVAPLDHDIVHEAETCGAELIKSADDVNAIPTPFV